MPRSTPAVAPLRAGAAQTDITPAMGIQLAGDIGRYRPAEVALEPLYARALVLEAAGRKVCIVSLDLLIVMETFRDRIRGLAAQRFGFDPDAVIVHAVQNHSAPSLGDDTCRPECKLMPDSCWFMRGGDNRYNDLAVERIVETIGRANEALQPARIGSASGIEARLAFNRRFVMRDGKVKTHPRSGDPNILHAEGPMDPEVGVTLLTSPSLGNIAALLHYTCHPIHGYPHRWVSHDWPGAWSQGVQRLLGPGSVALVLNGCCGNIASGNHLDPTHVQDYRRMGEMLTEDAFALLRDIRPVSDVILDYRARRIRLPVRKFDRKELKAARDLLKRHPDPTWTNAEKTAAEWSWVYAVALLDLYDVHRDDPWFDYDIQVLRVGDNAYVALGGEPFVEGQLRIKQESPVRHTYIAHMAGTYAGYIPTRQAFERGGYETHMCNWSKLAPEALDGAAEAAIQVLKDVFGNAG